ncbi:MAG: adenylosuccinate synthase, partial [Desulfovibrio sp.]|nr:adenylosuccinate synthase [Desulfovibrio sp.]
IGPCYEDKMARIGLRASDLMDSDLVRQKITRALTEKNVLFEHLYKVAPLDPETVTTNLLKQAVRISPYIQNVDMLLENAISSQKQILFEGAQGTHLDIDHGTYPFVTSSNTVAANAATGSGISPLKLDRIVGIVKAYTTRVGAGPFPTELHDNTGTTLQKNGHEFGATTGRPRRCGWLDTVLLRASARLNGLTELAVTKLDVLCGLPSLKICTAYRLHGETIDYLPFGEGMLAKVEPVYEELPGFNSDISQCKKRDDLPKEARCYLDRMAELINVPLSYISVGPDREQTIVL